MPVLTLGVSYRHAPVSLLERLSLGDDDFTKAYHHLSTLEAVGEAVVLSTCNRVEVYADVTAYHEGFRDLKRFLSEARDVPVEEFAEPLYSHYEDDAADHLFAVASGIDSMVVGEPQILHQVRAALRRAEAEGSAGPVLQALFRHAARVGRRAREETAVGASPAAFVEAGADLAERHLEGLDGRALLVVGAGKMSALAVAALRVRGIGPVRILNRTPARAARLAEAVGAEHGSLEDLPAALAAADLVMCSTGSTGWVIGREAVAAAGDRPRFFLDLAVPRDVEPGVRGLRGQGVADIDDLRGALRDLPDGREVALVRDIITEEVGRAAARRRASRLAPVIQALRSWGEGVAAAELARLGPRLSRLAPKDREAVEALARGIVNKLLHQPVVRLKQPGGEEHARALAELFGLDLED
jgi:glutamyl-tRNA reductase